MSRPAEPRRLVEDPRYGALIEQGRATGPSTAGEVARGFDRLEASWRPVLSRRRWAFALAGCAAAALLGLQRMKERAAAPIALAGVGSIEASAGAIFRAESVPEPRLFLERGRIYARIEKRGAGSPFVVVTPQLRVVVVGTRFSVEVEGGHSTVHVDEGRVRVELPEVASDEPSVRLLSAGEQLRDDELREPTAPSRDCDLVAGDARRACLEGLAQGEDLRAENALYRLGLEAARAGRTELAARFLRAYLTRFPHGLFAPEAAALLAEVQRHEPQP